MTSRLPAGSHPVRTRATSRRRRRTRFRTTAPPTARVTTNPILGEVTRVVACRARHPPFSRCTVSSRPLARLPWRTASSNSWRRLIRAAAGSTMSPRTGGAARSGAQARPALPTASRQDRATRAGPHPQPEAVRLRPTAVVGLKCTLAHCDSRCRAACVVGMTAHLARRPMRCPRWPSPGASQKPPNRPSQPDCVRAEEAESGHGEAATSRPGPRTLRPARVRVKPRVACGQTDGARHPRLPQCPRGPLPTRASANQGQCQPGPLPTRASAERALRRTCPGAQWRATRILPWYAWRSPVTSDAHPRFVAAPRQGEGEHQKGRSAHRTQRRPTLSSGQGPDRSSPYAAELPPLGCGQRLEDMRRVRLLSPDGTVRDDQPPSRLPCTSCGKSCEQHVRQAVTGLPSTGLVSLAL